MNFLLDSSLEDEKFLAGLPAETTPLGYLVVGERHLKGRQPAKAIRAYESCLALPCDAWLKATAWARLEQVERMAGSASAR